MWPCDGVLVNVRSEGTFRIWLVHLTCYSPCSHPFWWLPVNGPGNPVSEDGAADTMVGTWVPELPLGRHVTSFGLHIRDKLLKFEW